MSSSLTDWSGCNAKGESFRISAHVVPTSGICESRTLFRAIDPAGIEPAGIEPAGETPRPIEPAGIDPAGMEPAGIEPAGIDPAGIEPAGIEPAGIEPAGSAEVVPPRNGIREAGMLLNGSDATPAAIERSSTVRFSELAACVRTWTVTS